MIEVKHARGTYPVEFGSWAELGSAIPSKSAVLVDSNVLAHWGPKLPETAVRIVIPSGEASKSHEMYAHVAEELARHRVTRDTAIVGIGGGVVGDLAGFLAATYMRGVPFVQVPTTLLAMVDSSVGGKVGIDLAGGKNLLGAFYPPVRVFAPMESLSTLPERHLRNGMAEVWKYGYVLDAEFLVHLRSSKARDWKAIASRCVRIKEDVVAKDEFDRDGLRAVLNFGHTVGHALETLTGYGPLLHGEAIAVGMVVEARLGTALDMTPPGTAEKIEEDLRGEGLPTSHDALSQAGALLELMAVDKKVEGKGLAFSLLTRMGACKLVTGVPAEAVRDALRVR